MERVSAEPRSGRVSKIAAFVVAVFTLACSTSTARPTGQEASATAPPAGREHRIALVIGNATYARARLDNPVNDAGLISRRLRQLGFDVDEQNDLTTNAFKEKVDGFVARARTVRGVVVVYYAGHGLQIDGRNFLLPIDVDPASETAVRAQSIDVEKSVLSRLDHVQDQIRILILDACRDNPFGNRTRDIRRVRGLAQMGARGTLIAYASAPGATAEDGAPGGNSVYSRHLADEIGAEGVEIEQVFKRVRIKVLRDTWQRQMPWVSTSLASTFSFRPRISQDQTEIERQEQMARIESELAQARTLLDQVRAWIERASADAAPMAAAPSSEGGRAIELARLQRALQEKEAALRTLRISPSVPMSPIDDAIQIVAKRARPACTPEEGKPAGFCDRTAD